METHPKEIDKLIERIEKKLGAAYDPKRRKEAREVLADLVHEQVRYVKRDEVLRYVDQAFKRYPFPLDWRRWLCIIFNLLPGRWVKLDNNPGFGASTMLLLTDGTVMCQEQGGKRWKKLTPDNKGSYIKGTWSDLAPMNNTRRYYASAVLNDGRVFVSGGEYSDAGSETNKSEVYDPITDTWTPISAPTGWTRVGDAANAVLPDGRVLMGNLDDTRTAIYDPVTNSWTAGPAKGSRSAEESWVLLPDDTVITVRCNSSRRADKYVATTNTWVDGGTLPQGIVETASSEIGAGVLLNDGRAFFAGANNHTALYTPPAVASDPGTWNSGPDFPNNPSGQTMGCKDTPSCLMTNGKVLISAGPVNGVANDFLSPTSFFEYDGAALHRVADPPNSTGVPYIGRMLLLPTGQILYAAQTDAVYAYTYFSCPEASWRPQITACPTAVRHMGSYTLHGRLLNGNSQAVGYGDDASAATNYPIVRIRHKASGTVTYCRTGDHSTMAVATGSAIEHTNFRVPWTAPIGPSELYVVANGIASYAYDINVRAFRWPWAFDEAIYKYLIGSLADGPLWVLGPHGPIPVDPWGPKYKAEAKEALKQLVKSVEKLRELGGKVQQLRGKAAQAAPLAPDDDDE